MRKFFKYLPIIIGAFSIFLISVGLIFAIEFSLLRAGLITLGIIGITISIVLFEKLKDSE